MIAIWKTGHIIADTVADALTEGFNGFPECNAAIGYGILRGMDKALARHKHWFVVDNGYFNPDHFNGYYRISYKGTQSLYDADFPITTEFRGSTAQFRSKGDYILICPPTDAVCAFYGVIYDDWCNLATHEAEACGYKWAIRNKGNSLPLVEMLASARAVITFNSSVGWLALQQGIPCLSDSKNSVVGSYYKSDRLAEVIELANTLPREPLFNFMRSQQFTLQEIKQGKAWALIKYYLRGLDGTDGKQSRQMYAPTASEGAPSHP